MTRKCSNCGNPAHDDSSVFCNKCGARLPVKDMLTCKRCGTIHSDPKSQFCIKCGTPLGTPSPPVGGKICHACGFVNADENSLYCKKCGIYLAKNQSDIPGQKGSTVGAAIRSDPVSTPRQKAPDMFGTEQNLPARQRDMIQQKSGSGSYRKIAAAAVGIIMIIVIIGAVAVFGPGILHIGTNNSTISESAGSTGLGSTITATQTTSPGSSETKTPAAGSPVPANTQAAESPVVSTTSAPLPSVVSTTPAQNTPTPVSPVNYNSTPPWLSGGNNITQPWPTGGNNTTSPWPVETNSYGITPPWLSGAK